MGRGIPSYLSSTICDEFVELMGKEVLNHIIKDVRKVKYFAISVDSTPEAARTDQLTFIIRYVDDQGMAVQRFLKFIPVYNHGAEYLSNVVISTLQELGLNISNCRGQCYDNANNMTRKYKAFRLE